MPTFILLKDGEKVTDLRGASVPGLQNLVKTATDGLESAGGAAEGKEEETVSGGYTIGSHSDWKTSL